MFKTRICKNCGQEFQPISAKQRCCNIEIIKMCPICGKEFTTKCHIDSPKVCSRSCASQAAKLKEFTCAICGTKFHPNSSRQKYCKTPKTQVCEICGNEYETFCGDLERHTCKRKECRFIYSHQQSIASYQNEVRVCKWCGAEFTPVNNTQIYCTGTHYQTCKVCGREFVIDLSKQDKPVTCSKECGYNLRFLNGNPFSNPESREKAKQTYFKSSGYYHPTHNPEVWRKIKKSRTKLELKISRWLTNQQIKFIPEYTVSLNDISHRFDFYLPDYKILIDADGEFYHGYISDPNGKHYIEYYDEQRLKVVPHDYIFHVIVENHVHEGLEALTDLLNNIDSSRFNYSDFMFTWCRSIDFPYPNYTTTRMLQDFTNLNKLIAEYDHNCKYSISLIRNFHKSLFHKNIGSKKSIYEIWKDDSIINKVIENRAIYLNSVDPFKVLSGFNALNISTKIPIFNPVLARYVTRKYLSEYEIIFDPMSQYSGCLLGVASVGKQYIGQDSEESRVQESLQIIEFLDLANCEVNYRSIVESSGTYPCLLTYINSIFNLNCDEWIDMIIDKFDCKRYVFVVDETTKYENSIAEIVKSTSTAANKEVIIVI